MREGNVVHVSIGDRNIVRVAMSNRNIVHVLFAGNIVHVVMVASSSESYMKTDPAARDLADLCQISVG